METLRASLRSGDRRECAGAQQVLISLGTGQAIAALADSLQTADNVAVANTARLLGGIQARSAIPALIRCLDTRSDELDDTDKRWVARSSGLMPQRDEIPVLAELLREPRRRTRTTTAWALAQIRSPESQAALELVANELSWFRGRAVRRALRAMRERAER
jgi:HEAT repeat protein